MGGGRAARLELIRHVEVGGLGGGELLGVARHLGLVLLRPCEYLVQLAPVVVEVDELLLVLVVQQLDAAHLAEVRHHRLEHLQRDATAN